MNHVAHKFGKITCSLNFRHFLKPLALTKHNLKYFKLSLTTEINICSCLVCVKSKVNTRSTDMLRST